MKNSQKLKKLSESKIFRLGMLLSSLLILIIIWWQRENLINLSKYGMLGIFLVNLVASATVLVPLPGIASVFVGGAIWSPVLVGIASALGSSIGEIFGYMMGYGGRGLADILGEEINKHKWFTSIENSFKRAGFVTTLLFSIIPFPFFDLIGLLAGVLNYPIWKFGLATLIGRVIRNIIIAFSGAKFLPL